MPRFAFVALMLLAAATSAAADPPDARAVYVERRGLLEADERCQMLAPNLRTALRATLAQARGTLLRSGWSSAQVRDLDATIADAAGRRACNDARTATAAADARAAFASWANANAMSFPGWQRTWTARRVALPDGWRLSQPVQAVASTTFGVRERDGRQQLTLTVQVSRAAAAPTAARLVLRDPQRGRLVEIGLSQRMTDGLAAGAPAPASALTFAAARSIERTNGAEMATFVFPDAAFRALSRLDPRESATLEITRGRSVEQVYVEVGDIGAALAFASSGG